MKDIKIKRLALENFKCHKSLTIDFNGRNVSIFGDNATGKTSVYDSLMWLLFDTDSRGNGGKSIEIKPLGEGGKIKDHNALTAAEAVMTVDGEEITLRRTLKEIWTTKRGSVEPTYDGNTSEYYIDGVPVKKTAFSEKIDELTDENTFKLLTNTAYFAQDLSWQDRRAVLFRIAGVLNDDQILAMDERFRPLVDSLGRLSIDDYKKKLLADKRGFVGAKTEIPARISECEKTIEDVQMLDFDKARSTLEKLNAKRTELESQIIAIEHDTASESKRMEIREARVEFNTLQAENNSYRAKQIANAPDIASMRNSLARLRMQLTSKERLLENNKDYISKLDGEIDSSRTRWIAINGEIFTGGECPTCGQALPAKQLSEATGKFEANKKLRLREIEQTANAHKASRAAAADRIDGLNTEIEAIKKEIAEAEGRIKVAENYVIEPSDMEGYDERIRAIEDRIHGLEGELADIAMNTSAVKAELQSQISALKVEADKQRDILSRESLLEYSRKRVEELQEDARNAAACLDAIEQMLYLIDEYARYKTQFVEDSINGMFRIARFRLFREQANGGIEDRCDVVFDNVPYINLNSGAKINVGIDIINTLSRAYGISVPLFIDNAESVTNLERSDMQIIRLVVSENDKELRINYEN